MILRLRDDKGNEIVVPAIKGDKGDPFTYEDFTEEQLSALKSDIANAVLANFTDVSEVGA